MGEIMKEMRSDISESLVHFTKERKVDSPQVNDDADDHTEYSALDVLCQILKAGKIIGSNNKGFIKGTDTAVCFTECPLSAVKLFASGDEVKNAKYRFYGIAVSKQAAFKNGARPVIYLPDEEGYWIPEGEKWRHVRFEYGEIDWTFEREWRKKGDFDLRNLPGFYIVHWSPSEQRQIDDALNEILRRKVRGYLPMKHLNQML